MHRFFVSPEMVKGNTVEIDKEQAHHIKKVLRLKTGDNLVLFDGLGNEYICRIQSQKDGMIKVEIDNQYFRSNEPVTKIILAQGIAKGEKMDYIIQKAVEIGVTTIVPFTSERTVVTLTDKKAEQKVSRWQNIAREACKQCGRNVIPEIQPVIRLPLLINALQSEDKTIMLYENEDNTGLKDILAQYKEVFSDKNFVVIVGPEGGFSLAEAELAKHNDIMLAALGSRILRTETAGLVAASIILYEGGDLG